jgi:DNA-directed RNA polymerase alpha subunit
MHELRTHNLYALEDFTQASEDELMARPRVGRATIVQIHSYLQALGLDFKPTPHPGRLADIKTRVARKLPPRERRISDDSHIGDLGLRTFTLGRCMQIGLTTVGALQRQSLRDLYPRFGLKSLQEIVQTLDSVGLELHSRPSQSEKWRFGAISKEHLKHPADHEPIRELQPWLGKLCDRMERAGVETVGALRSVTESGGVAVRGLGHGSWDRINKHFGVPVSRPKADAPDPSRHNWPPTHSN